MSDTPNPRAQLAALTRQARAWVEWLADSGVQALPSGSNPEALLAELDAPAPPRPRAARQRSRPAAPPQSTASRRQPAVSQARPPQPAAPPAVQPAAASAIQPLFERPATPEARHQRLAVLAQEVASCTKCRLHESRNNVAFSRGTAETELVFVGEGPGYHEDKQGLPFVGNSGKLLDQMIAAMGYQRDDVYICNIVKCRPPENRKPTSDEMRACLPYLQEQLAIVAPKAIVTLGATGAQGLLNTTMNVTRMRGRWKLYRGRTPLMPTFHPAYLLRQAEKKREVWTDLKQVMKRLGKKPPAKKR